MAAHRFWMLYVATSASGSGCTIGELVLAETASGPQAAVGGAASASATESGWPATNAFDGVVAVGNGWSMGAAPPQHLVYDMGAGNAIEVAEIRVTSPSGATMAHYPTAMTLLYSDDGVRWAAQRSWGGLIFSALETKTLDATPLPSNQVVNRVVLDRTLRYTAAANTGAPSYRRVLSRAVDLPIRHASAPARKTPWTGQYYIAGNTTTLGEPIARRVELREQMSGLLVAVEFSTEDGAFRFDNIGPGPWSVVGVDVSAEQNSVIYAHVTPSPTT